MIDLNGPRLKLRRADQHLKSLKQRIKRFVNSAPYTFVVKHEAETDEFVIRCYFRREAPNDWPVVVGDFAHNARSALDLLVSALSANTSKAGLSFTLAPCPEEYMERMKGELAGVSEEHRAIIESFQPYNGLGNKDVLAILHEINRYDKHRLLNVVTAFPEHAGVIWNRPGGFSYMVRGRGSVRLLGAPLEIHLVKRGVITEDGAIVARGRAAPEEVQVDPNLKVSVQFGQTIPRIASRPVVDTLTAIRDRLKEVISQPW